MDLQVNWVVLLILAGLGHLQSAGRLAEWGLVRMGCKLVQSGKSRHFLFNSSFGSKRRLPNPESEREDSTEGIARRPQCNQQHALISDQLTWGSRKSSHILSFMVHGFSSGRSIRSGSVQFSSVVQLSLTLCDPVDCSTPGLPVHHQLPEFTQTHVHWVSDAIQASHPMLFHSPAFSLSQHQGLFQWVRSSHLVAKVLTFQLQY